MIFFRDPDGALVFQDVDPVIALALCDLVRETDPGEHSAAQTRLHPPPSADPEVIAEWTDYVAPELDLLFQSADQTVTTDLALLDATSGSDEFMIPALHLDAWLNVLTRARLVLSEKHNLEGEDLESLPREPTNPHEVVLLKMVIYGMLLELILSHREE